MKKALITGITGQDGSFLTEFLIKKGYEVHGIKRRTSMFNTQRIDHIYKDPHLTENKLQLHYGDLSDASNLTRIVRDVEPDENNPWTAQEILKMVNEGELKDLIADGRVITSIIPDIESVNYGRGVGYEIIEHIPPNEIGEISATSIRKKMRKDGIL